MTARRFASPRYGTQRHKATEAVSTTGAEHLSACLYVQLSLLHVEQEAQQLFASPTVSVTPEGIDMNAVIHNDSGKNYELKLLNWISEKVMCWLLVFCLSDVTSCPSFVAKSALIVCTCVSTPCL